jgi:hypothetical protein
MSEHNSDETPGREGWVRYWPVALLPLAPIVAALGLWLMSVLGD